MGLTLPKKGNALETATDLFTKDLPALTGKVSLNAGTSKNGEIRFEQVVRIDGEKLPLFDRGAVAHFVGDYLKALTAEVVSPATLVITGKRSVMTATQAKERIAEVLNVPIARIFDVRKGIHLVDDDPAKARVAYELSIDSGAGRDPIKVVLDQATRQILDIK